MRSKDSAHLCHFYLIAIGQHRSLPGHVPAISLAREQGTATLPSTRARGSHLPAMTRRGAPNGNLNALKTGFYSRLFNTGEIGAIEDGPEISLEQEITLLRVMIRRTMELADGIDDLREATRVLDALGAAAGRLANLLRAQKSLREKNSQLADEISIAIQQVNEAYERLLKSDVRYRFVIDLSTL